MYKNTNNNGDDSNDDNNSCNNLFLKLWSTIYKKGVSQYKSASMKLIVLTFTFPAILGMIILQPGYKAASRVFQGYENQPRKEVIKNISLTMPNVGFRVFKESDYWRYPEEFFYNQIRLVINDDDKVVMAPYFFGTEPDLSFAQELIGKDNQTAVDTIRNIIPSVKIVVQSDDGSGMKYWESTEDREDYVAVEVSSDLKVNRPPHYVRVVSKY